MCWRDDVAAERWCPMCRQRYYGDLGHRDCPAREPKPKRKKEEKSAPKSDK